MYPRGTFFRKAVKTCNVGVHSLPWMYARSTLCWYRVHLVLDAATLVRIDALISSLILALQENRSYTLIKVLITWTDTVSGT
jgi:hypothetical protein